MRILWICLSRVYVYIYIDTEKGGNTYKNMPALHIGITQNIIMENRLLIEQLKLNLGCDFEYNSIINFAGDE